MKILRGQLYFSSNCHLPLSLSLFNHQEVLTVPVLFTVRNEMFASVTKWPPCSPEANLQASRPPVPSDCRPGSRRHRYHRHHRRCCNHRAWCPEARLLFCQRAEGRSLLVWRPRWEGRGGWWRGWWVWGEAGGGRRESSAARA